MKNLLFLILIFTATFTACQQEGKEVEETATMTEEKAPKRLLRHVVMFKFKDSASQAEIKAVEDAFLALPDKIREIHSLEWGINNSPEGLNKGLTHCFFLTFKSEADRAVYLPHPDHQAFGELLGPILDDVTVVDYWTTEK